MKRRKKKGGRYTAPARAVLVPVALTCRTCGWSGDYALDPSTLTPCPEHGYDGMIYECPSCGAENELSPAQILAGMAAASEGRLQ